MTHVGTSHDLVGTAAFGCRAMAKPSARVDAAEIFLTKPVSRFQQIKNPCSAWGYTSAFP